MFKLFKFIIINRFFNIEKKMFDLRYKINDR